MTQVVVLAGGLGTRMRSHSAALPKVLLPVAGQPFLDLLLRRFAESAVSDALFLVGHLGAQVAARLESQRPPFSVRVRHDGESPLGTLGALVAAAELLEDRFVLTYGDSYLELDYSAPLRALERTPAVSAVMTVHREERAGAPGNARVDGDRVLAYAKEGGPGFDWTDYGMTALEKRILLEKPRSLPAGFELLQSELAAAGRLGALPVAGRYYEIGSPKGLDELERHLRGGRR